MERFCNFRSNLLCRMVFACLSDQRARAGLIPLAGYLASQEPLPACGIFFTGSHP
jgi:hypothetical protein